MKLRIQGVWQNAHKFITGRKSAHNVPLEANHSDLTVMLTVRTVFTDDVRLLSLLYTFPDLILTNQEIC